jgi:hypothetical protein
MRFSCVASATHFLLKGEIVMANMFSNKTEKQIPKTLNDCVESDATVANLHSWAEWLESWGKFLFRALIVIGIISTIFDAIEAADVSEELIVGAIITSAISWALYAFIEYCAYHVLALLVSALAIITQNTTISANVALLEASQHHRFVETASAPLTNSSAGSQHGNTAKYNTEQEKDAILLANGGWKCVCGRVNASYVSSCACHRSKAEISVRAHQNQE